MAAFNTQRQCLCTYFSPNGAALAAEVASALRAARAAPARTDQPRNVLALMVPHGAACDGFFVAAHAYAALFEHLAARGCRHLTAVLLGTEHRGTTPVALSRLDWATPLGVARCDQVAVDWLASQHGLQVHEAPHAAEHSIENQLPFLLHGAASGWDLEAAAAEPAAQQRASTAQAQLRLGPHTGREPASLSIVPVSIGFLGAQPSLVSTTGAAVAALLRHLRQRDPAGAHPQQQHAQAQAQQQQQQQQPQHQQQQGGRETVLIVTSDLTHAGPGYRELPPPGTTLSTYMAAQDAPVLQALQQGSVERLLAAAQATRSSMCGLWPLAVALHALFGECGSAAAGSVAASPPRLLTWQPAHELFCRADSTGFAALVVEAAQQDTRV